MVPSFLRSTDPHCAAISLTEELKPLLETQSSVLHTHAHIIDHPPALLFTLMHFFSPATEKQYHKLSSSAPPAMAAIAAASTASGSQSEDVNSITPLGSFRTKASRDAMAAEIISASTNDTTPIESGDSAPSASNNTTPTSYKTPAAIRITSPSATDNNTLNVTNVSSPARIGKTTVK